MRFLVFIPFFFSLFVQSFAQISPNYELARIEKEAFFDSAAVVTSHPLASQLGAEVLRRGGNAIDAMVAVHFALAVVYPRAGNIGGGGFLLYRQQDGQVFALDFREQAPAAAHKDMYLDAAGKAIDSLSRVGYLAVGVPGSVAGMWQAHQRFGKLPWKSLVLPSVALAKAHALTKEEAATLNRYAPDIRKAQRGRATALLPSKGNTWQQGDSLRQEALAQTLLAIAEEGRDGFYTGAVAQSIAKEMQAGGGLITAQDLADYQAKWREPIQGEFRGYQIWSMPPPSSGGIALLQLLGMIEPYPLEDWGFHSPRAIHLMAEAERRVYADRSKYPGDPDFVSIPQKALLEKSYLGQRMQGFRAGKATKSADIAPGQLTNESEETTHYSIVDAQGNAVSLTTTINTNFGAKIVADAGFVWNNEMDDFSAKPGSPNVFGLLGAEANAIAPGKRMLSSMTPTIVCKGDSLYLVVGTPGGATIISSVFQVFVNTAIFGLSLKQAVHAKRFHHQWQPDVLYHERGIWPRKTRRLLSGWGHKLQERSYIGKVEAIRILPSGKLEAVADNRGECSAEGY